MGNAREIVCYRCRHRASTSLSTFDSPFQLEYGVVGSLQRTSSSSSLSASSMRCCTELSAKATSTLTTCSPTVYDFVREGSHGHV